MRWCSGVPLLAACVFIGAVIAPAAVAKVTMETVDYHGWKDSIRLTNGEAEVVIVPSVGRVMRYATIGGPNRIWEDPLLWGKSADDRNFPRFGGNKAWPWPQDEWPKYIGHDWPPPPAADQTPFTASTIGSGTVRLQSAPVAGFGVRIVRDITLAASGTRVTLVTRLERTQEKGGPVSLGAWSITPVAAPETLLARLTPGSTLADHYKPLGSFDPFASVTATNGILHVVRQKDKSSKIGIDGDALGAVYGDTLFLLRSQSDKHAASYLPGEHLQIYANADSAEDTARGLPPYMELEMTSPKATLSAPGDTVTLTETWELRKLAATGTDAAESALLRGDSSRP